VSYSNEPPNYGTPPPPPGGGGYDGGYGAGGGGYGGQQGGGQPAQTSVMAIISLVTGILGVVCCGSLIFSIAAIILGFLAKKETDSGQKTGGGMALAGLILGGVGVVLSIIWIILWITTGSFNVYSDF